MGCKVRSAQRGSSVVAAARAGQNELLRARALPPRAQKREPKVRGAARANARPRAPRHGPRPFLAPRPLQHPPSISPSDRRRELLVVMRAPKRHNTQFWPDAESYNGNWKVRRPAGPGRRAGPAPDLLRRCRSGPGVRSGGAPLRKYLSESQAVSQTESLPIFDPRHDPCAWRAAEAAPPSESRFFGRSEFFG